MYTPETSTSCCDRAVNQSLAAMISMTVKSYSDKFLHSALQTKVFFSFKQRIKKTTQIIRLTKSINQNCIWLGETWSMIILSKIPDVSLQMQARTKKITALILLLFKFCCAFFWTNSNLTSSCVFRLWSLYLTDDFNMLFKFVKKFVLAFPFLANCLS